jgi:hypothetical protein
MPPVFGPVSCSPRRLKSCAGARASARSPSLIANSETSSPSSSSSIMRSRPSADAPRRPASSSSCVWQTKTPFPAANPSIFTTHGGRATARRSAVGTPAASSTSLAKDFEPSIRAAARVGPKAATPPRRSVSTRPTTSGASGPTTTRSIPSSRQSESRPSPSSARTGWHCPRAAMPGLPGAACSSSSSGLAESFQASACSRPPDPTISTFTAAECTACVGAARSTRRVQGSPGLLPKASVSAPGRACP